MKQDIRVRFAPSPTGPLHIGGVRTALYNYLFAKKHQGTFVLRIEDTDQIRSIDEAESHILNSLEWLGLSADESVLNPGNFGPYRQSERKKLYRHHVDQLLKSGHAYYAFDSPEDLENMRMHEKEAGNYTPKYDQRIRLKMKNSLTLPVDEVNRLLEKGENVTVRLKIPENETITFSDRIRGEVSFKSSELDDKIILKADGMPTYHLANVVDDKTMRISHVIRGEEWLSSTAHHVLLYRAFSWEDHQPDYAHLPLILKPTGKGKLSKRDGAKFGFPVFPLEWYDQKEEEQYAGFKEAGFLPAALLNFMVLLGWNPGNDEEIFDIDRMIELFDLDQINKSGAQFNYNKAKWFNEQYIQSMDSEVIYDLIRSDFPTGDQSFVLKIIDMLKPRTTFLNDFKSQSEPLFYPPASYDKHMLKKKYKHEHKEDFQHIATMIRAASPDRDDIEKAVKRYIVDGELKFGAILPVLRIFLTGSMSGPDLFEMISLIGNSNSADRIEEGIAFSSHIAVNG